MKKELQRILWVLLIRTVRKQHQSMLHLSRIKAATYYVQGVRSARLGLLGYLGLCFLRLLFGAGFLLLHAGLFLYLPWDLKTKGFWLLVLGGAYLLIAVLALAFLLSQRMWMRVSGADQAVHRAVSNQALRAKG